MVELEFLRLFQQICVNRFSLNVAVVMIIGISLVLVGVTAIVAPMFASAMYGVAVVDGTAQTYVRAAGIRDVAIGCWLLALSVVGAGQRVLGISVMAAALIPAGDAIIVWVAAGKHSAAALTLHGSSAIIFVALGFWLLRTARKPWQ
jgi:hypothetical protein